MKWLIQWAVKNGPAVNTLVVSLLLVGAFCLYTMRRETFPEFDLDMILVTVPYPGASPSEVEDGICQKIEEAVRSIDGIKKQTAVAREGVGFLALELETGVRDPQKVLNEVRSEIDRIPSFPELAEDPEVRQITFRESAIRVGVIGPEVDTPEAEMRLREIAEQVRDELIRLPTVSQANLMGTKAFEIDIEIPEQTLRKYGLTLQQVAQIVRRENLELPGGTMKTDAEEVLLRGKNKRQVGEEIAQIPLVTDTSGVVLKVADLCVVRDEFADTTSISRIDGKPGLVISVDRTSREDLLSLTAEVRDYVSRKRIEGYELRTWADRSVDVKDRMRMLVVNGLQGLVLVFLMLAIFLDLRLAFWVALGIPISIFGAGIVMWFFGQTMNMLTMFSFLMTLGIVVDDGIVIGENIYEHRTRGKSFLQAATDGAFEVLPSVFSSVATTIVAFLPLFFVAGIMGKFIAVMPLVVVSMLCISMAEATFSLPCHLAHKDGALFWLLKLILYPLKFVATVFAWANIHANLWLASFVERFYLPVLRWALGNPATVIAAAIAVLFLCAGVVGSGLTPFIVFPKIDNPTIEAKIAYPDGTPAAVTDAATRRIEAAMQALNKELAKDGQPVVLVMHRMVGMVTTAEAPGPAPRSDGGHVGSVNVELVPTSQRSIKSEQVVEMWRERSGDFPGVESLTFGSPSFGPGGTPIEFKLLASARDFAQLQAAVEECKTRLRQYPAAKDVRDDSRPGKAEFHLTIKERAVAMGVPLADLAETVRAAYYGDEVMRLQRGRHEVKLMVRYPEAERRTLAAFDDLRVRTGDGAERPLTELADVRVERPLSEFNRIDQLRSITISSDLDENSGNAQDIVADLQANFMPDLLRRHPGVIVRWEGQQEQTADSFNSLLIGFVFAILAMYVLLTMEFRSYLQPLLILAIIPFGFVGAVVGHMLLRLPITLFSVFGLVTLAGVVVNDAIVLIDFINLRLSEGAPLHEALVDAGRRRFRAVFLTSITTVGGLAPMLFETSFQAQLLIPMATSMCFGLSLTTLLVLVLMPTFYLVYARALSRFGSALGYHSSAEDTAAEDTAHAPNLLEA